MLKTRATQLTTVLRTNFQNGKMQNDIEEKNRKKNIPSSISKREKYKEKHS